MRGRAPTVDFALGRRSPGFAGRLVRVVVAARLALFDALVFLDELLALVPGFFVVLKLTPQ